MNETNVFRNLANYVDPLIDLFLFEQVQSRQQPGQQQYGQKMRIAAMRSTGKMVAVMDAYIFEKLSRIIPAILQNVELPLQQQQITNGAATAGGAAVFSTTSEVNEIEMIERLHDDESIPSLDIDPKKSLIDESIVFNAEHVRLAALELLSCIARASTFMKPMFEYVEDSRVIFSFYDDDDRRDEENCSDPSFSRFVATVYSTVAISGQRIESCKRSSSKRWSNLDG